MSSSYMLANSNVIYKNLTEDELIEQLRLGDSCAEEYLYRKYSNSINRLINSFFLLGGERDDLFQEAMIGLYNAIRDYDKNKNYSFKSYADLCIKRQIITAIRQASRQKHHPLNSYISLYSKPYENSEVLLIDRYGSKSVADPEDLVMHDEDKRILYQIMADELSSFEKLVLKYYISGLSYVEISAELNKDVKAVDNALQRIRKKIKKKVSKD